MDKNIQWLKDSFGLTEEQCRQLSSPELSSALEAICLGSSSRIKKLEAQLAFYKEAINSQPNPIFVKNDELRYVFLNRKYYEFFCQEPGDLLGKQVTDLEYLPEEERRIYHEEDTQMLENQSVVQHEKSFQSCTGIHESLYWSKGFTVEETGERGVIGEIVDISKEKKLQRDLKRHSSLLEQLMKKAEESSKLDPATNVYNRYILTDELPAMLESAKKNNISICGILCDIDDFKYVNDNYGHIAGDEVISKFANAMKCTLRQNDIIMRYGGDEFAAVLTDVSLSTAKSIAERLRSNVSDTIKLPKGEAVTISIGVTQYRHDEDIMSFITRMDEGMYMAKKSGKNQVEVF